jgi:hypothetical protein
VRAVVVLAFVAACSFRTNAVSHSVDSSTADTAQGTVDGDAARDARAIDAPPPIDAAPQCPGTYATVTGAPPTSRYRLFSYSAVGDQSSAWAAAKQTCETDGTHLIIVETAAEATAIAAQLQYSTTWPYFWDGVTDAAQEASWKTVLGADATYLPWGAGQPSGGTAQNCAVFGTDGVLYDYDCITASPFACECD